MPPTPPVVVVAQVRKDREEPRREPGLGRQSLVLLVKPHEHLGYEVVGVRSVVNVPPGKGEQRLLPPRHQPVKRSIVALLQCMQVGIVVDGVGVHWKGVAHARGLEGAYTGLLERGVE